MNFEPKNNIKKENYKKLIAWVCAICFVSTFVYALSMVIAGRFITAIIALIVGGLSFIYSKKYFGTNKEDEKINMD